MSAAKPSRKPPWWLTVAIGVPSAVVALSLLLGYAQSCAKRAAWSLVDEAVAQEVSQHADQGTHLHTDAKISLVGAKVDAAARLAAQQAQLVGTLVCLQAGGVPTPSIDPASAGLCVFLSPGKPPVRVPLSDTDALLAEIMARAAERPP